MFVEKRPGRATAGFTLVELLVVIAIIGIMASIAITQYAVYKQKAVDSQMESSLQAGRHAMEAYYVDKETYQTASETVLHDSYGFRYTAGVDFKILDKQTSTYQIQACAVGGTSAAMVFDSTVGRSVQVSTCS